MTFKTGQNLDLDIDLDLVLSGPKSYWHYIKEKNLWTESGQDFVIQVQVLWLDYFKGFQIQWELLKSSFCSIYLELKSPPVRKFSVRCTFTSTSDELFIPSLWELGGEDYKSFPPQTPGNIKDMESQDFPEKQITQICKYFSHFGGIRKWNMRNVFQGQ